jgi:hypothetical protein
MQGAFLFRLVPVTSYDFATDIKQDVIEFQMNFVEHDYPLLPLEGL